jgi:hypothetical protein
MRPAPRSLSIMTSFRFQRSTRAPATGPRSTVGPQVKKATSARAVACPVISQAQIVRANQVIPLPSRETTWPNHTMVNPSIPLGRVFGVNGGSSVILGTRITWTIVQSNHGPSSAPAQVCRCAGQSARGLTRFLRVPGTESELVRGRGIGGPPGMRSSVSLYEDECTVEDPALRSVARGWRQGAIGAGLEPGQCLPEGTRKTRVTP